MVPLRAQHETRAFLGGCRGGGRRQAAHGGRCRCRLLELHCQARQFCRMQLLCIVWRCTGPSRCVGPGLPFLIRSCLPGETSIPERSSTSRPCAFRSCGAIRGSLGWGCRRGRSRESLRRPRRPDGRHLLLAAAAGHRRWHWLWLLVGKGCCCCCCCLLSPLSQGNLRGQIKPLQVQPPWQHSSNYSPVSLTHATSPQLVAVIGECNSALATKSHISSSFL